jgi:hypothetical protein
LENEILALSQPGMKESDSLMFERSGESLHGSPLCSCHASYIVKMIASHAVRQSPGAGAQTVSWQVE